MKTINTIKNFAKRLVMILAVGLMTVNVLGTDFNTTYNYSGQGTSWSITNATATDNTYYKTSNTSDCVVTVPGIFTGKTITGNVVITLDVACFGNGSNPTSSKFSIYNSSACSSQVTASQGGTLPNSSTYTSPTYTITQANAVAGFTDDLAIKIAAGTKLIRFKSFRVTFTYTSCNKSVTVTSGTSSTNGSISTITGSPVATCDATAANRTVTITVSPNTGYVAPDNLSFSVTSGSAVTATKQSGPINNVYVYSFAQNDNNSTCKVNVACVGKQCTLIFDQNGGTGGQTSNLTATYGSAMPAISGVPNRDHYDFEGYYDGAGGTGNKYYNADGTSATNWNKNTTSNTTLYAKWTEHSLTNYRTRCCTPLAQVDGQISVDGINEGGGTASWTWTGETTGISSNTLKIYDTNDEVIQTISNLDGDATSYTMSGLDPCHTYYVTLTPVAESNNYCPGEEQGRSDNFTIHGWGVYYDRGDETDGSLLSKVTKLTGDDHACLDDSYMATFQATAGYKLPETIVVYIAGVEVDVNDKYTWVISNGTGTLTIDTDELSEEIDVRIIGEALGCTDDPDIKAASLSGTYSLSEVGVTVSECSTGSEDCGWTDYGFVWGTSANPTVTNDTHTTQVGTSGNVTTWSGSLNGSFSTGTTYYFRAYGKNSKDDAAYAYSTSSATFKLQSVTFNSNGGSLVDTKYVKYNTAVATPDAPTRLGYDFAGWKLGENTYVFSSLVTGDITLDAAWTNHNYTITKTLSNCTSDISATHTYGNDFTYTITADDKYVLPATITVTMGGNALTVNTDYTWDNATGELAISKVITGDLAITVTAQRVYSVTLNDKNVVLTQESAGANVTLPTRKSCEGYAFQGWSTTYYATWSETQPTIIPAGSYGASLTKDINLYPVYKGTVQENRFSSYTKVTTDQSDWSGKYLLSTGTYTATGAIDNSHHLLRNQDLPTSSSPTREFTLAKVGNVGYSLLLPDGSLYIGYSGSSTTFAEAETAPTADNSDKPYLWTPSTTGITNVGYSARKISNGDDDFRPYSNPSSGIVYLYKRIETLQDVDKYISVSGCCEDLDYIKGSVTATTQTSATLEWNKLNHVESENPYSLSYKEHGSSAEPTAFAGTIDLSGAKATCTVTNLACGTEYDFILHIDAVSGYCDTDSTINGTTGKYAVTKADATNGSFTTSVAEACEGTSITLEATPASEAYEFTRWTIKKTSDNSDITSDVSLGSVGNASTSFTMPAFGVTVFATFDVKKAKYDITLNANGGQSAGAGTITEGSNLLSIVTAPGRTGYNVAGYYTLAEGGVMVADATGTLQASVEGWTDGDGKFTKNAAGTLYTHWSVQSFTLAWNTNGGSDLAGDPTTGTVAYGTALTLPTQPTKTGYHFLQWNSAQDGNGLAYDGYMPAANTTYYAQWEIDNYTVTWLNNGNVYAPETAGTSNADYNTSISTIPSPNPSVAPTQCSDKVFMGWTKVEINGVSETNPGNIFTTAQGAPKITENTTFHAVWADRVGGTYELVTSESAALANGDKIIIATSGETGNAYAIGKQNDKNRSQTSVSIDTNLKIEPDLAEATTDSKVHQFQLVTNNGYFNIKDVVADKYLACSGDDSNNYLKTQASGNEDKAKFTITIDGETNAASIVAKYTNRNKLRHNSTSHLFACYDSGQNDVYVYRELISYENYITACCKSAPVVGAASSSNVGATTATVICAAGATIGSKGCSIEEYGFVVGKASNPEIGGANVTKYALPLDDFVAGASFSKGLSNLSGTYYVRPFATNALGTTYGTQTSFATAEVTSISVKAGHGATKTAYVNGESFNGAGLIIIEHLNNSTTNEVTYDGHEGSFSFSPSTLTTNTTSVTITCSGKTTSQAVTVYAVNDIVIQDEDGTELSGEGKPTASRNGATLSTSAGTEKYVFKEWQVTNASVENNKIVNPTDEVSITAVYWKPRVVTWLNNNVEHTTTTVAYNTKPEFPSTPSSDDATSTTFAGWSDAAWVGKKALSEVTATIYASANDMQEMTAETATYHAVFMKAETGYFKVSNLSDITAGQYVIVSDNKALPNTNTGSTDTPAKANVTIQNNKVVSPASNIIWTFTGTNTAMTISNGTYYLYNINDNKGTRVYTTSTDTWAFEVNSTGFAMKDADNGRYCATYTSDWRSYITKDADNYRDNGIVYLYKYVDNKSDYMTTKTYTVTCQVAANSDGYGTVSPTSVTNVLKGTSISVTDNVLNIGETAVTATPTEQTAQYHYAFSGWSWTPNSATVGNSDVTATASFTRTVRNYDITATLTNVTADVAFPANRDYGSSFSCTISVGANYMLPSTIEVEGAEYEWNATTGALNIASIVGPVSITISGVPSYSLIFKNSNETVVKEIKVADGTADFGYTIVETPTVTPEGYEFLNQWADETSTYNVGEEIHISAEKTLYPVWKVTTTTQDDVIDFDGLPASVVEIIVTDGKDLNINEPDRTIDNLTVEAGGKVSGFNNLTVINNLLIKTSLGTISGDETNTNGKSGEITNGNKIVANGDVFLEIELTQDAEASYGWYAFSVPFPVDAMNGVYYGNTKLTNEDGYAIMSYHGDVRAQGHYAWKKYRGIMQPGVLYIIAVGDTDYKTLRFKKVAGADLIASNEIAVKAYPLNGGTTGDNGWNGIGNPNLQVSRYTGSYLIQFLDHQANSFKVRNASAVNLMVGSAFMMQSTATENITITAGNNGSIALAPAREMNAEENTLYEVKLRNNTTNIVEDNLFFMAREDATNSYETGYDLVKLSMGEAKCAQMYVPAYGTKLCAADFRLVNDKAEYPLTITAPADGTYRIEAAEAYEGATLYLTKDGRVMWNLSMSACEVELSKGTTESYGLLLVRKAPGVATGMENVQSDNVQCTKVIIDNQVFILRGGQMYDLTGKKIEK